VFGNADKADWIVIFTTIGIGLLVIVSIVAVVVFRSLKNINEKNKKYTP